MERELERAIRAGLWMVRGVSSRAIDRLATGEGGLAAALGDREALARAMGVAPGALLAAPADLAGWARNLEAQLRARGGRFLWRGDPEYPDLSPLADPPEILSVRGSLVGPMRRVAVIGSRRPDPGALRLARAFGVALARRGIAVVSGGALGIDAAAHEGAVEAGGHTIAVLGSGLLRPHPPRNRSLFARILAAGGALCGELPPDAPALRWHFPRRNRLIAALAEAVVVVRAGEGSGCRYTVEPARAWGRPVLAVPAPGEGNELARSLVERGEALPVRDADELLEALGLEKPARAAPPGLEREERQVLDALSASPAPLVAIASAARLEAGDAARILARLCACGLAAAAGPGRFVCKE